MDKLRDETLAEILKKEKAYAHELRSIIPELQLLRDIFNGKRPKEDYEQAAVIVQMPMMKIAEDDTDMYVSNLYLSEVGKTYLVRHALSTGSAHNGKRYIVHRVK